MLCESAHIRALETDIHQAYRQADDRPLTDKVLKRSKILARTESGPFLLIGERIVPSSRAYTISWRYPNLGITRFLRHAHSLSHPSACFFDDNHISAISFSEFC